MRPGVSLPLAALEAVSGMQRVVAVDALARAQGVMAGMALNAALALCPVLDARPRDPRREQALLVRLAELALNFTPRVSLEPPDGLLLEVRGSLGLFGGTGPLVRALGEQRCVALGLTPWLAMAPTPLAALALARTGHPHQVTGGEHFVGVLAPLPLAVLRWPPRALERLASMGVHTLGAVLRLPRAGFARRFGREALEALDRLLGRRAEPRRAFIARERFRARCEPSFELTAHDAILRYLGPLLDDLEAFLRSRQAAITALHLRLQHRARHDGGPVLTRCTLRLAAPEFVALRFAALLAEHLARIALPAPVIRCELRSGELLPFAAASAALWRPGEQGGGVGHESPAFIEQLRARLGADAVYGLCLVPEHRPEHAWRVTEPALGAACTGGRRGGRGARYIARAASRASPFVHAGHLRRPLWLLRSPEPLPCALQSLQLLEGPERIETGWWDGRDVARDYYIARDATGAELWVFRERLAPHGWFLHGMFA